METNWLEIWYEALASTHGVEVSVSDPVKAQQALYRARASSGDASLEELTIRTAPTDKAGALWIVKKLPKAAGDLNGKEKP